MTKTAYRYQANGRLIPIAATDLFDALAIVERTIESPDVRKLQIWDGRQWTGGFCGDGLGQ